MLSRGECLLLGAALTALRKQNVIDRARILRGAAAELALAEIVRESFFPEVQGHGKFSESRTMARHAKVRKLPATP